MSNRITRKDLEYIVERINEQKGFNREPEYSTIGAYTLSYAYGGASLHQYTNKSGGIRDVLGSGHVAKKDLYFRMKAYLEGLCEEV